ncbi:conserved hypothetical protein [Flavobacterium sp. 9AF]|uniref:hypothetical protein n=1 Tax=Flavobacterium sp. 9AF TaxID=2653142 RepID=UPI0012EF1978|nr:hypothetical protein [Flavobacterium sp. 9AF]VXC32622.1 conserved hypothetical protein [Flavobacterium sp. 9AF]
MDSLSKILFVSLFSLFYNAIHSQENFTAYYTLLNQSKKTTDSDSSFYYLEKAITTTSTPFAEDVMSLSMQLFNRKEISKAKKAFLKAVSLGYEIDNDTLVNFIPYKIDYSSFSFTSKVKEYILQHYEKEIKKFRTDFLKNTYTEDNKIFESFLHNEHYFQDLRFLFYDNKVNDSLAFNAISKYGATPSSYFMLEILKKNKFPDRRKCIRFNGHTITMLLNHAIAGFLKKEDALEFITLLWPLVETGKLTPREYAMTYDHYYQWYVTENKNYFGTVFILNDDNKSAIMSLADPINIDTIRKKHFLIDLKTECKNYNVQLPENYEK